MSATRSMLGSTVFTGINRLSQFHENPAVIAWWRARMGRALNWLTPYRRRAILAVAAVCAGIIEPLDSLSKNEGLPLPSDGIGAAIVILALFGILYLTYRAAAGFVSLPTAVRRHPQLALHLFYWGFLLVLWNTAPTAGLWRAVLLGVAIIFPYLIWRCGYLLLSGQHGRIAGTSFADHLIYLWPAYGGTETPYGKGLVYLSQHEAKTEEELARSQLAGIKLFFLAVLWGSGLYLMEGIFYGGGNGLTRALGGNANVVPALGQVIKQGTEAPLGAAWASVYCELIKQVLRHAASGHIIIGILRLFGFNVFRNTYKPLLAESIIEFWNRYFYYFKELLVNFFFLPTFTGLGKKLKNWPHLRLFAAVFAAAFVGNVYYHVIKDSATVAEGDMYEVLFELRARMFYCLLLASGIFVSMLRQQRQRGQTMSIALAPRILRMFGVWTFFSLIFIWGVRSRASFSIRMDFFLGLFGLA